MNDPSQSAPDLSAAFREAFRHHPSGVAVITADAGAGPTALTVSSLISVSGAPPTVAFSLSAQSSAAAAVVAADSMVIHFMRRDDLALARLGATSGADRFGPGVRWDRLPTGEPFYPGVRIWFRALPLHRLTVEGATLIVARLAEGRIADSDPAPVGHSLVYLNRDWFGLAPLPTDPLPTAAE